MIENYSDALSFYTILFFVIAGLYMLFVVSSRPHEEKQKRREEAYYNLLDEIGNEYEEEDETQDVSIQNESEGDRL